MDKINLNKSKKQKSNEACKKCNKEGIKLKLCQGCKTTRYCNKECQASDWETHKIFCLKEGPRSLMCYGMHKRMKQSYVGGLLVSLLLFVDKHACNSCVGMLTCIVVCKDINKPDKDDATYVFIPMMSREGFKDLIKRNPEKVSKKFQDVKSFPVYTHTYIQESITSDGKNKYECKVKYNKYLNLDDMLEPITQRHLRRIEISKHYDFCIAAFEQSLHILRIQNNKIDCIPPNPKYVYTKWFTLDEGEIITSKNK